MDPRRLSLHWYFITGNQSDCCLFSEPSRSFQGAASRAWADSDTCYCHIARSERKHQINKYQCFLLDLFLLSWHRRHWHLLIHTYLLFGEAMFPFICWSGGGRGRCGLAAWHGTWMNCHSIWVRGERVEMAS